MSEGHTEDLSVPPSPHSSPPNLQDFPALPTHPTPPASTWSKRSWISGRKEEGSSTLTTRASQSLQDLLRGSKKAKRSPPPSPHQLAPVPSSPPAIPPLDLSSSLQTITTSFPIPEIDSHALPHDPHGLQTRPPPSAIPRSPYAWIPKPSSSPLTYEELQQQLRQLLSESTQPGLSSSESPSATKSLPPSTSEQVAQEWRTKQPPSTGQEYEPTTPKPTPSTKSSRRSDAHSPSTSSQGGSRSIGDTECASSLGDTLGSLSIRGWSSSRMKGKDEMTPDEWAYEYMSIWNTRCTDLTTEVSWRLLEAGQAWEQVDPVEQEDIISHSATEQAIKIFNEFYPRYALPLSAPYQSRYNQPPLPKLPPTMPTSRPMPGDHNPWEAPADPDSDSDIEVEQPVPGGTGNQGNPTQPTNLSTQGRRPITSVLHGDKTPDRYTNPNAQNPDRWSLPRALPRFDPDDTPPNPIGAMGDDVPWIGCKPDLIRKPLPFKGEPNDIDRFITDCQMYFQVHSAYMWLDPYRVAFTSSYFEDKAKDWWTLQLSELYSTTRGKYLISSLG
ncbi:hypothetical protein EV421DRAFT_1925346 [Armillaria borealis]|uniref:Uncharacterized protein n=1 Tax=Armillaria borealis TaxID=47425 RepID=A0AA39IZA7_9AGAR|nr:hypothetical protein EV421DRAFT_1925346 [Armillaria borealis]